MSTLSPTEIKFEEHIENHLKLAGYSSTHYNEYDRGLCLIKEHVIKFIQTTQPEEWKDLYDIYGEDTENKILSRISSEISKRGIIDVFRNGIKERGITLNLCYFEPKSGMNPEHSELYKSNQFTVVRQFHYSNRDENLSIDMGLFLNGLPIATMEIKNQLTRQNIKNAENQYSKRDQNEPLLKFKRCMVHFCIDNDKVSMTTRLSGTDTVFLPYNKGITNPAEKGNYRTKYFWEEILSPSSLLDIIENFVHISNEKEFFLNFKTQKIDSRTKEFLVFPRYHQLDLIRNLQRQLEEDGVGTNYLVQHTTGSGKSYSIGWLSHTLASFYRSKDDKKRMFDTIVVVTDRTVLDDQLQTTIDSLGSVNGVVHGVRDGSQELKRFLEQGKDIIITTIQKFPFISDTISSLGDRNFAVIIDEVHSSQSGELSIDLRKTLAENNDGESDDDAFDYEEMLKKEIESRGPQKHISFFGFTGTPKEETLEVFGTKKEGKFIPFHTYSMRQSVYEKFTLDVLHNYTTYKRYFNLTQIKDSNMKIPAKKGKQDLVRYVDSHEKTIEEKVNIMLDHWINTGSKGIEGQARGMIVTSSRKHCVRYFQEINRQLKARDRNYHCLVGFSGEVSIDGEQFTESKCNGEIGYGNNIPRAFKHPKYRLLVVANKFQTGFDEPLVQSMYIDKKLRGVQCVQTLSRLNRTMSDKRHTFVLDFVNEPNDIRDAFQRFYQSTILDGETDPNRLYELRRQIDNFKIYKEKVVNSFCKIFYAPNRNEGDLHSILDPVVDKFNEIKSDETKEEIRSKIQLYIQVYSYLSQIVNFYDIELEKIFVFLKYLHKKLPKREKDWVNIFDTVVLDSLDIRETYKGVGSLVPEDSHVLPPKFELSDDPKDEYEHLSKIINDVNKRHRLHLTKDERVNLNELRDKAYSNEDIATHISADNTEETKKDFFIKQLNIMILDYANKQLDFYKKMEENPKARNEIFEAMYKNYPKKAS